jgi:hypothetical protein
MQKESTVQIIDSLPIIEEREQIVKYVKSN